MTLGRESRRWVVATLLLLPLLALYAVHLLLAPPDARPLGYFQFDQPYYMAIARQHFLDDFSLLYGLPFSFDPATPKIYLQPQLLVLGAVQKATGWPPGLVFALFGLLAGAAAFRMAVHLFEQRWGLDGAPRVHAFIALCWGGGIAALVGLAAAAITGDASPQRMFHFDPEGGYWLLNFGRNMIYPLEALNHALVLASVAAAFARRYWLALAILALACASHPYTGVIAVTLLLTWGSLEVLLSRQDRTPWAFPLGCLVLLAAHLLYYGVFLGRQPENVSIVAAWRGWLVTLSPTVLLFCFGSGLMLTYLRLRRDRLTVLADRRDRLWLILALQTIALGNHHLFMTPHLPIHFVRGYLHLALFMLAAPIAITLFERMAQRGALAVTLLLALLLSDNVIWFGDKAVRAALGTPLGEYVSDGQLALYTELSRADYRGTLMVCEDERTAYLALLHTPLRVWLSHPQNTPFASLRRQQQDHFFATGRPPDEWRGRRVLLVSSADKPLGSWSAAAVPRGRFGGWRIDELSD